MLLDGSGPPPVNCRQGKEQVDERFYCRNARTCTKAHRRRWLRPLVREAVRVKGPLWPFLFSNFLRCEYGAYDEHRNDRCRNGHGGACRPGGRAPVRLSRRSGAADLRCPLPAAEGQAHPGAARAGRRACGRGLRSLNGQGRLRTGDLRARCHQCGDRAYRRADELDPAGLSDRPGPDSSHRQRCLPGMRHSRHHAALHQAQLSGEEHYRSAARAARSVSHRAQRSAWPGCRRHPQGHPVRKRQSTPSQGSLRTRVIGRR